MELAFNRVYPPAQPHGEEFLWLVFRGGDLLVMEGETGTLLPQGLPSPPGSRASETPLFVGMLNGLPCLACALEPETDTPPDLKPQSLRALYGRLPDADYALAGYASQLLHFQRTSRFCPACGTPTEPGTGDWARRCPGCRHAQYPTVHPAVLALVHDGNRILLAQKPGWGRRYSILAGFVEPGESLEECVHREVAEEAGVQVQTPVYAGSQPWPYPSQLMVGFTAAYAGGDIQIDETELSEACWFTFDALPELPPALSLSRQLIDRWIAGRKTG